MRALLLTLFVLGSTGCWLLHRSPTPSPVTDDGPCLSKPPPAPPGVELSGAAQGCEPTWFGCLEMDAGYALEAYIADAQRWQRQAWLMCGPLDGGL